MIGSVPRQDGVHAAKLMGVADFLAVFAERRHPRRAGGGAGPAPVAAISSRAGQKAQKASHILLLPLFAAAGRAAG